MKSSPHNRYLAACLVLLGVTPLVPYARAGIIYFDDFTSPGSNKGGPYTSALADAVTKTGGGTWLAGVETNGWGQTGDGRATPTSSNFLAFTPDPNRIYTVQATIDTTALGGTDPGGSSSWFALGFTSSQHNWNGVDAATINVANLVRFNSNKIETITYTLNGDVLQNAGVQYVGWITDRAGAVNLDPSNEQVKITNFSLISGVATPTLTYDGNGSDGGEVPTDGSSPYTYATTVTTLNSGSMTRSGFTFIGWNTAADGSGTSYSPGATFTIYDHTTLYATWLPNTMVTLTYNGNGSRGGSVPVDPASPYVSGSEATVLNNSGNLTKPSYSFSGWNTAADGSGLAYNPADTFTINSNTTLFAQWTPGPNYVWDNQTATNDWNTTEANWSGATWSNAPTNNAFFTTVGGLISISTPITAGALNVGNSSLNFANLSWIGSSINAATLTVQGRGSNPGNYDTNPTLSIDSTVTITGDASVGRASLNIAGGTFTADRIISSAASADWGRLVISGGTVTATNGVDGSVNTSATFAMDLNGGELLTPFIRVANREQGTVNTAVLTLNGGRIKAIGADNANFIQLYGGGQNTYVAPGGAMIDTNGLNIGIAANLLNAGGGLTKHGEGTLTLSGVNTYSGDTTINAGSLVLADNAQLRFVVTDAPASNMVTGSGSAVFRGDFNIDTTAVSGSNGHIWTLVDRNSLTNESFDPSTFSVVGFTDPDHDGVWTMTDSKGSWSFSEATGELTLDISNDYNDWGAQYGLSTGSESGDLDGDGLTNQQEYAFGLIPNSAASCNPITQLLEQSSGKFRYTRRATPASSGLTYTVWTSENLIDWSEDTAASASQTVTETTGGVETVEATISGTTPLTQPKLFIRVKAE